MFKCMFLEKISDVKTPTMLLKEFGNLKMKVKEKDKDFNNRFLHILNNFLADMNPSLSITTCLHYQTTL